MAYKIIQLKKNKDNEFKMKFIILFCFMCKEVALIIPISIWNIFHQYLDEKADRINVRMKASFIGFKSITILHTISLEIQHLLMHKGNLEFAR